MGGALVDDVLDIVRNISASFSVKLSHILALFLKYKHAGSVGAVAGFALAILCTWRYISGNRSRRRPVKRDSPQPARPTEQAVTGVSHSITQASHRGAATKEQAAPAQEQLTLARVVKRQLNGARKMTCQLLGIVLQQTSSEELQSGARVRTEAVEVLVELSRACDLYLLAQVIDDDSEAAVMSALEEAGLFEGGSLNRDKVLFCSTPVGLMSFVRQLEPEWHVDVSEDVIRQLPRYVRHLLWIAPVGAPEIAMNVVSTPTVERYFGLSF